MSRYGIPSDEFRCKALARWSSDGKSRCKRAAYGPSQLCKIHRKFPPRPEPARSVLIRRLAVAEIGVEREIRIELRERDEAQFVSIRLFLGEVPTRKAISVPPEMLGRLAVAVEEAAEELES